jgi:putative transposase
LSVRRRGGRKRAMGTRRPIEVPLAVIHDQLTDGRRFRILAIVDNCTRECLALVADTSISGRRVARELDSVVRRRGQPRTIVSDNVLSWDARALSKQQVSCAGALPVVGCVLSKWLPPAKGCSLP